MIIDWRTMEPFIGGEGVDAIGNPLPKRTCRVNTETGEVLVECRDEYDKLIITEDYDILRETIQMVPPITVWLYT